jgi:predicted transcriptional regulator
MSEEFQALLHFYKVLVDENRLKLLGLLAYRDHSVEELAALLQVKESFVLRHLGALKKLGLVDKQTTEQVSRYRLNSSSLRDISKELLASLKTVSTVDDTKGEAWERKVLRDFFEGTRLKEIPAQSKKRAVIVKWLATQFEYGVLYKEREVNEIIKRHHPDFAYFRRQLVDMRYMQRENGVYWRNEN